MDGSAHRVEPQEYGESEARKSSVDVLVSELVHGLYDGQFKPGQKLVESELAQRFGVGRGSIREALRRLEAEGFVTVSLHRGASIKIFDRDGARDTLEITAILAGMAARLAAQRLGSTHDARELRECADLIEKATENQDHAGKADARYKFFRSLAALSQNREFLRLIPRYDASVIRNQFREAFDADDDRKDALRYRRVVDSILARDAAGAEANIQAIIQGSSLAIQRLPDSYFAK